MDYMLYVIGHSSQVNDIYIRAFITSGCRLQIAGFPPVPTG
jgi:hypothetical protein